MYLTSDLMAAIKRRANVPTSQVTFTTTDFYALIDEEIRSKLVPLVLKNREEFYVRNLDYAIQASQNAYMIPTRAIAGMLRDVQYIRSAIGGQPTLVEADQAAPLERLDPASLFAGVGYGVGVQKTGFLLQGNSVLLYPTPTVTRDTLRLPYYCRPGTSVDPSACGLITAIDPVGMTVSVSAVPTTMSAGVLVDFVKASPGFECTAIDQAISSVVGLVVSFASLPSGLSVGDYLCPAGQSCVIQVPVELQPLLTQYGVVNVLAAQGDPQLDRAQKMLDKLEENAELLIAPRVSGKPKRVVNTRGISRLV